MTTPDPLPSVAAVRKARWSSIVACGCYVTVGQVIVRRDGRWSCLACALQAVRARAEGTPRND